MTLKEYKIEDRTYLFDDEAVPEGAELVGDIKESVSPGTFEALVLDQHAKNGRRRRRNKQLPAPENKSDDVEDDTDADTED